MNRRGGKIPFHWAPAFRCRISERRDRCQSTVRPEEQERPSTGMSRVPMTPPRRSLPRPEVCARERPENLPRQPFDGGMQHTRMMASSRSPEHKRLRPTSSSCGIEQPHTRMTPRPTSSPAFKCLRPASSSSGIEQPSGGSQRSEDSNWGHKDGARFHDEKMVQDPLVSPDFFGSFGLGAWIPRTPDPRYRPIAPFPAEREARFLPSQTLRLMKYDTGSTM